MKDKTLQQIDTELREKIETCKNAVLSLHSAALAFSGGVDSTLLLALATETLGADKVLAVTVASALHTPQETEESSALARQLGIEQVIVRHDVLAVPAVAHNPPDRCYHCKKMVFTAIREIADQRCLAHVASGDNATDTGDYRPGMRALREMGVATPLLDAGFTKADIRKASAAMALPTADKPSAACLASRVPYNQTLTPKRLERIGQGEAILRRLGFRQCRLRDHGQVARIEVPVEEIPRAVELRDAIVHSIRELGWTYVSLDLLGFRSGAMNEGLSNE